MLQGQLQARGAVVGLQGVVPLLDQIEAKNIHNVLLVLYNQNRLSQKAFLRFRQSPSKTLVFRVMATVFASWSSPAITWASSCS